MTELSDLHKKASKLAKIIDREVNPGEVGKPAQVGFILVLVPVGEDDNNCFLSNLSPNPADLVPIFEDIIEHLEDRLANEGIEVTLHKLSREKEH